MNEAPHNDALSGSLLEHPDALPLVPADAVLGWGRTLMVAPHPDDESLACGGALALLAQNNIPVRVLCVTDGTLSHPNSVKFPAPRLRALREKELRTALSALGVGKDNADFLGCRDRHTPAPDDAGFADVSQRMADVFARWRPHTVLLPWRRDPHPDHRAAWVLARRALEHSQETPRLLEWPLWTWAIARAEDAPRPEEARAFRLDIAGVLDKKRAAIACHASQVSDLIDDDSAGFRLTPDVLRFFLVPHEVYLEDANWKTDLKELSLETLESAP